MPAETCNGPGAAVRSVRRLRPLFGASKLNLKVVELPVRYGARVYGETNIRRFRDGLLLLRVSGLALWRLKLQSGADTVSPISLESRPPEAPHPGRARRMAGPARVVFLALAARAAAIER